jgi:hypothetical protein
VTLLLAIKASADIKPADLGTDGNTAATLAYIQAYPVWERVSWRWPQSF